MIFDNKNNRFTLKFMDNASKSLFTFRNDFKKHTACTTEDIFKMISKIAFEPNLYKKKIINLGIKKMNFGELQNIGVKKQMIPLITLELVSLLSLFSPRFSAYSTGKAITTVAGYGHKSSFD